MTERNATAAAFLISPLVPTVGLAALTLLLKPELNPFWVIGFMPVTFVFSALFMTLFGAPAFLLGKRLNLVRWWSAIIVGSLLGTIVDVVVRWPGTGGSLSSWVVADFRSLYVYIDTVMGALTGFVFWLVWRRGQSRTSMASP